MKRALIFIPLIGLLSGCVPGGGNIPILDNRTQVPGATQVNNYLEQVTTPESIHCVDDGQTATAKPKSFFHDGYAKISTNHVQGSTSYLWDSSWDKMIGDKVEETFPEFLSDDSKLNQGELNLMGCGGYSLASKKDKKRFWALFLASLARVQSGFDISYKGEGAAEKNNKGLFAMNPAKMKSLNGECAGVDDEGWSFMEPTYSFGCALEGIKAQMSVTGKLFSDTVNPDAAFTALTGPKRHEFIKFFKNHASPQFAFCQTGVDAPSELITAGKEGESSSSKCDNSSIRRISDSLDRSEDKIKGATDTSAIAVEPEADESGSMEGRSK